MWHFIHNIHLTYWLTTVTFYIHQTEHNIFDKFYCSDAKKNTEKFEELGDYKWPKTYRFFFIDYLFLDLNFKFIISLFLTYPNVETKAFFIYRNEEKLSKY